MKTEALIDLIAQEPARPALRPARIAAVTLGAVCLTAGLFLALAGPRADLAEVLPRGVILAKTLLPALICAASLTAALRLARPGTVRRPVWPWLALPLAAAAALWLRAFLTLPGGTRFAEVGVFSLSECIGLIVLIAALPAAACLALLRDGASVTPRRSAFWAGLAAGAGAATGYSFFCTQDNPLFYVTWYGTAMLIAASLSALFGARLLRW